MAWVMWGCRDDFHGVAEYLHDSLTLVKQSVIHKQPDNKIEANSPKHNLLPLPRPVLTAISAVERRIRFE
jgi:hypothetical protein